MEAPIAVRLERHTPSVLIVEDDPDISKIIAVALEDSGYAVHTASRLTQAERVYRTFGPDVVLCDLILPDGLGSELLRRLSSQRKRRWSPASILMSSHPDAPQHARHAHADAYLSKPFDLDELCSTVDRVLSKNGDA